MSNLLPSLSNLLNLLSERHLISEKIRQQHNNNDVLVKSSLILVLFRLVYIVVRFLKMALPALAPAFNQSAYTYVCMIAQVLRKNLIWSWS